MTKTYWVYIKVRKQIVADSAEVAVKSADVLAVDSVAKAKAFEVRSIEAYELSARKKVAVA